MTKTLARRAKLLPKKLAEKDPALVAAMAAEADRLEEVVRRHKAAVTACATVGLLRLADSLLDAYGLTKAACGRLDYDDLIYGRSEEHTSELQSLMRISYAVFCLKKKKK